MLVYLSCPLREKRSMDSLISNKDTIKDLMRYAHQVFFYFGGGDEPVNHREI